MVETPNLTLPYLVASQAQKHVTVNEALFRLDALAQLVLRSRSKTTPASNDQDGSCYFVPENPSGDFAAQSGKLGLKINGGWVFVTCRVGWTAYIIDEAALLRFDGLEWHLAGASTTPSGASLALRCEERVVSLSAGSPVATGLIIPKYAMVIGVTGRITRAFSGTATRWKLGVAGAVDRYASGMGFDKGSWLVGMSSTPTTYYTAEELIITAQAGAFSDGEIRLCLNYIALEPPKN